jgi:plastocyanin
MLLIRAIAAALAVLMLGGCGGVGGDPIPAEARGGRVEITLDDFLVTPQLVRARTGELTFEVTNRGRLPHNFRVRGRDGEPVQVPTLLPGERGSDSATLRRGEYKILCTVGNHEQLGMYGRLVVR